MGSVCLSKGVYYGFHLFYLDGGDGGHVCHVTVQRDAGAFFPIVRWKGWLDGPEMF